MSLTAPSKPVPFPSGSDYAEGFAVHGTKVWVIMKDGLIRRFGPTEHEFDFWTRVDSRVTCIHIAADGKLATADSPEVVLGFASGTIGVFAHEFERLPECQCSPIVAITSLGDKLISIWENGVVCAWSLSKRDLLYKMNEPQYGVLCLATNTADKHFASGSADGTMRYWYANDKHITKITNERSSIYGIAENQYKPPNCRFLRETQKGRMQCRLSGQYQIFHDDINSRLAVYTFMSDDPIGFISVTSLPQDFRIQVLDGALHVLLIDSIAPGGVHRLPLLPFAKTYEVGCVAELKKVVAANGAEEENAPEKKRSKDTEE